MYRDTDPQTMFKIGDMWGSKIKEIIRISFVLKTNKLKTYLISRTFSLF